MAKNGVAEVDILPSIFVRNAGVGSDYRVAPAVTGEKPIGISGPNIQDAPIPLNTNANHATAGNLCTVLSDDHQENETVMIKLTGAVNQGDHLMPDAGGTGAIVATSGNWAGAVAQESGAAGETIRCNPIPAISIP